jgi:1-acyl-sn-glycerol-3-phosphate acyltransferase
MRHLRAAARLVALCLVTAGFYALWLAGLPFVSLFAGAARRWRSLNFCGWARVAARIAGMRISARGRPPRAPFLLVSNHLGYMDVVAFAALVDCVFVAKSEVARWPVIGLMCRTLGTIFVNRGRRRDIPATLERVRRTLNRGAGVVIFAEGTSTSGRGVAPFKPSLLEVAAREGVPVHYATLGYRTPPGEPAAREAVCWWGDMTFPGHLYALLQLPRFEAEVRFGERPVEGRDRKLLAEKLWSAVNAQFVPVA